MCTVAASLLVSVVGAAPAVHADPPGDPAARLQVVIKSIYIRENESIIGSSDLHFLAMLCPENTTPIDGEYGGCGEGSFASFSHDFSADSGDNVVLERVMPGEGDGRSGDVSLEFGMPVYDGHRYVLWAYISNTDEIALSPTLGEILVRVDAEHGWGIGTGTARSNYGDFVVTYEIRRTALPDLAVSSFRVDGLPGSESVCGLIQNVGPKGAGPVGLDLSTEGRILEHTAVPALAPGASTWHCIERSALPAKKHNLVFSLDQARTTPETEELNNVGYTTVEAIAPGAASATDPTDAPPPAMPSPEPKPGGDQTEPNKAQADLTVRAIKVNGQAPDGKDDCKVGKNTVTVVVKNGGKGDAGSFVVQLSVDGNELSESVDGLDAGQEHEVRFDDVSLKAGSHPLTAVADPEHAVSESKDSNNELKVTATCKGN